MAFKYVDRVRDTTMTLVGTTVILSGSAPTNYLAFNAANAFAVNDTFYFVIASQTGNEWEVRLGTLATATSITSSTLISSSTG